MIINTFSEVGMKEHTEFGVKLVNIHIEYEDKTGETVEITNENIKDFFSIRLFFNHKKGEV